MLAPTPSSARWLSVLCTHCSLRGWTHSSKGRPNCSRQNTPLVEGIRLCFADMNTRMIEVLAMNVCKYTRKKNGMTTSAVSAFWFCWSLLAHNCFIPSICERMTDFILEQCRHYKPQGGKGSYNLHVTAHLDRFPQFFAAYESSFFATSLPSSLLLVTLQASLTWSAEMLQSLHHYFVLQSDGWKSEKHTARAQSC